MSDDPHIPDGLKHALRSHVAPPTPVPGARDQAILSGARAHLLRGRSRPVWRARIGAAAAVVLAGTVVWLGLGDPAPRHARTALDINHDRQVNILDALALARQGGAPAERIHAITAASVTLEDRP